MIDFTSFLNVFAASGPWEEGELRVFGSLNISERSMAIADQVDFETIPDTTRVSLRRIVWSSVIGTAVEGSDFLIYRSATALVFNKISFAAGDTIRRRLT